MTDCQKGRVTAPLRFGRSAAALALLLLLSACAGFTPPAAHEEVGFKTRAVTRSEQGLTVSTVALGPRESEAAFGLPLIQRGIQPVWLKVTNDTGGSALLLPMFFDELYFSPAEAAFINHGWFEDDTNAQIDAIFADHAFPLRLEDGATAEGFLFGRPDLGQKALNFVFVREGESVTATFVVPTPGLAQEVVDFDNLYAPAEIRDLQTPAELKAALEALPCCVADASGKVEADPLNFVIISEAELGLAALVAGGWDQTETVTTASAWKTFASFVFGRLYRYSPVSDLYAFGRKQDAAFQIARDDIHQRNHLRVWLTPLRFQGRPVWLGAISRDIGVIRSGWGTTHKIDPNVDDERWYLAQSLARAQALRHFAFAGGGPVSTPVAPRSSVEPKNVFYSDGQRIVLELSPRPVALNEIRRFRWEEEAEPTDAMPEAEAAPLIN